MKEQSSNPAIHVGITDQFPPDVRAMIMAKYSRDISSVTTRLPKEDVQMDAHRQALHKYYVNYGHKSIGQCGTIDVFFEGVSMLAAKAIEDNPLFNGQECSTRYIDMENQECYSPNDEIKEWQERLRELYIRALAATDEMIRIQYPLSEQAEGTSETVYNNTVRARAFDICRGILPAGMKTNVAMTATFDTFNEHFSQMWHHPLVECKEIALKTLQGIKEAYPQVAFDLHSNLTRYEYFNQYHFYELNPVDGLRSSGEVTPIGQGLYGNALALNRGAKTNEVHAKILNREKFQLIPKQVSSQMRMTLSGLIDFGSFRDLHRHRNGSMTIPLLTPMIGLHPYYLNMLPDGLRKEFADTFEELKKWYAQSETPAHHKQYAIPMGALVGFGYECDMNQALYICELRSGKTVHATLRDLAIHWGKQIQDKTGIAVHIDTSEDNFTLKRGTQTFMEENQK